MDNETEKWYEDQFLMFTTEGWKALLAFAKDRVEALSEIRTCTTGNLDYRKGALSTLDWLLTWETVCRSNYEDINAEPKGAVTE